MKIRIPREVGEIWKEYEGSKVIWKVKFPNGIMTFNTKKMAEKWIKTFELKNIKEVN